jgi:hypothetical protein
VHRPWRRPVACIIDKVANKIIYARLHSISITSHFLGAFFNSAKGGVVVAEIRQVPSGSRLAAEGGRVQRGS